MSSTRKRIQAYVNDPTYQLLKSYSEREGVSVSEAASRLLQTHLLSDPSVTETVATPTSGDYVTRAEFQDFVTELNRHLGGLEARARIESKAYMLGLHGLQDNYERLLPLLDSSDSPPDLPDSSNAKKTGDSVSGENIPKKTGARRAPGKATTK